MRERMKQPSRTKPRYWDVKRAVKESRRTIDATELVTMFRNSPLKGLQIVPLDSRYVIVDTHTAGMMLAYNGVDQERYKSDNFDCDNFAMAVAGALPMRWDVNCCGLVVDFSAKHAYNCIATTDNGMIVVEPQNDLLFLDYSPYEAKGGFVLFA